LECRIGGADLNPYLAFSAIIAAGLAGIDENLELGPATVGNVYAKGSLPELPRSLREATKELASSKMLTEAMGSRALTIVFYFKIIFNMFILFLIFFLL
jgi:glutamine synthetase